MHADSTLRPPRHGIQGFTLIELMIVVVVVGLLAAVALPSFMDSIRKSRRSDAYSAIALVQQAQERFRSNHASYAPLSDPDVPANGLGLPGESASGYYTLSLSNVTATTYTITATANTGKSQASDGNCKLLGVRMQGGNVSYGSGASTMDWTDPNRCWAK
nr:type IV pilin protein [uncultured Roseateles sp.]